MRTSPTQEQLLGAFALLRVVLKVLDETGGNVSITNVPVIGGTTADIHVRHDGSPGMSLWSLELNLGNGDPYRATGITQLDAARLVWWELCKESEVFAE